MSGRVTETAMKKKIILLFIGLALSRSRAFSLLRSLSFGGRSFVNSLMTRNWLNFEITSKESYSVSHTKIDLPHPRFEYPETEANRRFLRERIDDLIITATLAIIISLSIILGAFYYIDWLNK